MLKLGFCVAQLITDADNVTANVFVIAYVACVSGFSILGCAFEFLLRVFQSYSIVDNFVLFYFATVLYVLLRYAAYDY